MKLDDWADKAWPLLAYANTTRKNSLNMYRGRIAPTFGQTDLDDITTQDVQMWVLESGLPSIDRYYQVLRTLYREANKYNLTKNNPTDGVVIPKHSPKERAFLPWDTLRTLDFGSYTNLARFMALHGTRWSEALALTPDDIHDGYVHITKSIHGDHTKSHKPRKVPYLGYYEKFPTSYKWFREHCNRHGITIHSLRYTYAHSCKTQGVHVQVAQKLLGHSSITLTMDLYTKVLDDELDNAAEQLRGLVA